MGNQESIPSGNNVVRGESSGINIKGAAVNLPGLSLTSEEHGFSIKGAASVNHPAEISIKDAATAQVIVRNRDIAEQQGAVASSLAGATSHLPVSLPSMKRKYDQIDNSLSAPTPVKLNERFRRERSPPRTDPHSPPYRSNIIERDRWSPRRENYQPSPPRRSYPSDRDSRLIRQKQYDVRGSNSHFDSYRLSSGSSDLENRTARIPPKRSGETFFKNKVWRSDRINFNGMKDVPTEPNAGLDIVSAAAVKPSLTSVATNNGEPCQEQRLMERPKVDKFAAPGKKLTPPISSLLRFPSRNDRDDSSSIVSEKTATSSNGSASKKPCHICKTPSGQGIDALFQCAFCPRRYHRWCHTSPTIPEKIHGLWQCRRCIRKHVKPKEAQASLSKRVRLDVTADNLEDNAANLVPQIFPKSTVDRGNVQDKCFENAREHVESNFNGSIEDPKVVNLKTKPILMREKVAIMQPTAADSLTMQEIPETPDRHERTTYGNEAAVDGDTDVRPYHEMEPQNVQSRPQPHGPEMSLENQTGSNTASEIQPPQASEHVNANLHLAHHAKPARSNAAKRSYRAPAACTRCMNVTLAPGRLCIECQSYGRLALDLSKNKPSSPAGQFMVVQKASPEDSAVINDDELSNKGPEPLAFQEQAYEDDLDLWPKRDAIGYISARPKLPETDNLPQINTTEIEREEDTSGTELPDPPATPVASGQSIDQKIRRSRHGGNGLGDSLRRPKNVLTKMIQLALCTSPLQARGVCAWIVQNIPGYQHGVDCWERSIGATISMNLNNRGHKLWISRPWKAGDSEKYGKGQWLELAPGVPNRSECWDLTLEELVSPPRRMSSDDDRKISELSDLDSLSPSQIPRTATKNSSISSTPAAKHQDPEHGMLASADQQVARESSEDDPIANLRRAQLKKANIVPLATTQRSREHPGVRPPIMLKLRKLQGQDTTQAVDNFKWEDGTRLRNVSNLRISRMDKPRPLQVPLHLTGSSVLANLCKADAKNQDFSVKILYNEWPEYDPANEPDRKAKMEEIKGRPSRKQMIGKPASYSRLGNHVTGKSSDVASSRSPRKLVSGNIQALQKKFASLNDENLSYCDTLETFFDLPRNPIPVIYQGELAYRDGTRDSNGKIPRAKVIYKTG